MAIQILGALPEPGPPDLRRVITVIYHVPVYVDLVEEDANEWHVSSVRVDDGIPMREGDPYFLMGDEGIMSLEEAIDRAESDPYGWPSWEFGI